MPLTEYKKKRNFERTPEPSAHAGKAGGFRFVVHKHHSRRHHYDLRLEHDGVLKSWAVPKGVSMNPAEKRLAIMVEDHPYEYKDFEGLIPEGNYGAGSVIIWDEGTYEPLGEGNGSREAEERLVSRALEKGHLSFLAKGKKLKGEFSLVRLRNGENQWLVIKKADSFATDSGVTDERSARSGKTLEDLEKLKAAGPDDAPQAPKALTEADLKGAPKRPMPDFVEPMLATLTDEPFDRAGWLYEVKWDGYRTIAMVKNGDVKLLSRGGKVYTGKFPAIAQALKGLPFNAVFDGEVAALDKEGRSSFQMLQDYIMSRKGPLAYYVFDCLYAGARDLRGLPLERRKKILKKILPASNIVRLSGYVDKKGTELYRAAESNGLEGIIAKKTDSVYRSGARSRDWLKIKAQKRQEAVVCGFTEGRASRKYFGALVLGVFRDGKLTFAGHAGGGFDDKGLKAMYAKLKPLITGKSPFERAPKTNMPVTWVRPELVVEVKFREWTKEGLMRQPIVLGLSEDKKPSEAVPEEPEISSVKEPSVRTKLRLSNLYKIYWPKEQLMKKDLIKYYWRIADYILPYLKDRPQSLNRHPDGIHGKSFFQKDVSGIVPDWAKTVKVTDDAGKESRYLLCQDTDTLLFMANLGCIEINVWNSTAQKLDRPDYAVFDFDPVDVPFSKVVEAVLETKKVLDALGAPAFCKTSGSKGMHVYVPVKPVYDFEQVKNFAHLVNMAVKRRLPKDTSLERMPEKRKGLIYLDYLQNRYGSTMAAPYSVRPREGAPVSTPLGWDEVNPKLDPSAFNIRTVLKRVEKKGDLWKDLFKRRLDISRALPKLQKLL